MGSASAQSPVSSSQRASAGPCFNGSSSSGSQYNEIQVPTAWKRSMSGRKMVERVSCVGNVNSGILFHRTSLRQQRFLQFKLHFARHAAQQPSNIHVRFTMYKRLQETEVSVAQTCASIKGLNSLMLAQCGVLLSPPFTRSISSVLHGTFLVLCSTGPYHPSSHSPPQSSSPQSSSSQPSPQSSSPHSSLVALHFSDHSAFIFWCRARKPGIPFFSGLGFEHRKHSSWTWFWPVRGLDPII